LINSDGTPHYKSLASCINSQSIFAINIYKEDKKIKTYSPVWSYTRFTNKYQKIGITDDKILIHIKEI